MIRGDGYICVRVGIILCVTYALPLAGKGALVVGAFDERIALSIPQVREFQGTTPIDLGEYVEYE